MAELLLGLARDRGMSDRFGCACGRCPHCRVSTVAWDAGGLAEVLRHLRGEGDCPVALAPCRPRLDADDGPLPGPLASVLAAVQAAPGGVLLVGPPGSGKTMVARRARVPGFAPEEAACALALEARAIRSAAGLAGDGARLPFRAPHHTASEAALVGGGDPVRPGEATLAHGGVLFLDELPEFRISTLELLGEILRAGVSRVRRGDRIVSMPARPARVIAAANPCPCGYAGAGPRAGRECRCSPGRVEAWNARIARVAAALGLTTTIRMPLLSTAEMIGAAQCAPYPTR